MGFGKRVGVRSPAGRVAGSYLVIERADLIVNLTSVCATMPSAGVVASSHCPV